MTLLGSQRSLASAFFKPHLKFVDVSRSRRMEAATRSFQMARMYPKGTQGRLCSAPNAGFCYAAVAAFQ
jgi:hypothetical protein